MTFGEFCRKKTQACVLCVAFVLLGSVALAWSQAPVRLESLAWYYSEEDGTAYLTGIAVNDTDQMLGWVSVNYNPLRCERYANN